MHYFTSLYDLPNLCAIVEYMSSLFLIDFIHILTFHHAFNMHSSCLLHYHMMVHIWKNIFEMSSLWLTILCTLKLIYIITQKYFLNVFTCSNNLLYLVVLCKHFFSIYCYVGIWWNPQVPKSTQVYHARDIIIKNYHEE